MHAPQPVSLHVVLVEPEIPPNTGNVIRLCANTGAILHLIGPLGFPLDSAKMKRAGLDYHEYCRLQVYEDWESFWRVESPNPVQCFALSTRGQKSVFDQAIPKDAWFFFGSETRGLSESHRLAFGPDQILRLPMQPESRSLNLSNAVAVCVFEAWRQQLYGLS
ncbi:CspR Predicted rRNA methylase (SpoU class) [Burkholderiales bacterium]|jgi:tRNA (cytidine/uridine-2'-O-)-methyltransferase